MTHAFVKFYYWSALVLSLVIFTEMAFAEYAGMVLPSALMCLALAALAGALLGDWLMQNCIERLS